MKKIETLYIIDDDDTYQFIIQKVVEETQLVDQIKLFSNGKVALTFLESAINENKILPDVILLDISMPVMDGWEFLENFILLNPKVGKKITIYLVSSSVNPRDVEKARNIAEVTDYVVKPITKEKLIELISGIIHTV